MVRFVFVLLPVVCALSLQAAPGAPLQAASNRNATRADFDQLMKELSNWGRWGKDDQMGAVNLITPAKRKEAVSSVRDGFSVSMARNAETEPAIDNPRPINRVMTPRRGGNPGSPPPDISGASDTTTVSYHGLVHTHMDAFCHRAYKGLMYNGMPMTEVTEAGVQQGIYLCLEGRHLHPRRADRYPSTEGRRVPRAGHADLSRRSGCMGQAGASQDRAGRCCVDSNRTLGASRFERPLQHQSARRALHHLREMAERARRGDSRQRWRPDVRPSGIEGITEPIHALSLIAMGVPIFDNLDLEAVGREAAKRKRWDFLVTASPAAVPGATGSVMNPIATF